ncbi:MAG: DUF2917 domain-containing protein [Burkholderiaceae bacterium]
MPTDPHRFELSLERQALFSVADAAGLQIECREGSVWITLDGDPRDVVLEPNGLFSTAQHRRALIYALQSARVSVSRAATAQRTTTPLWQRPAPPRGLVLEQLPA